MTSASAPSSSPVSPRPSIIDALDSEPGLFTNIVELAAMTERSALDVLYKKDMEFRRRRHTLVSHSHALALASTCRAFHTALLESEGWTEWFVGEYIGDGCVEQDDRISEAMLVMKRELGHINPTVRFEPKICRRPGGFGHPVELKLSVRLDLRDVWVKFYKPPGWQRAAKFGLQVGDGQVPPAKWPSLYPRRHQPETAQPLRLSSAPELTMTTIVERTINETKPRTCTITKRVQNLTNGLLVPNGYEDDEFEDEARQVRQVMTRTEGVPHNMHVQVCCSTDVYNYGPRSGERGWFIEELELSVANLFRPVLLYTDGSLALRDIPAVQSMMSTIGVDDDAQPHLTWRFALNDSARWMVGYDPRDTRAVRTMVYPPRPPSNKRKQPKGWVDVTDSSSDSGDDSDSDSDSDGDSDGLPRGRKKRRAAIRALAAARSIVVDERRGERALITEEDKLPARPSSARSSSRAGPLNEEEEEEEEEAAVRRKRRIAALAPSDSEPESDDEPEPAAPEPAAPEHCPERMADKQRVAPIARKRPVRLGNGAPSCTLSPMAGDPDVALANRLAFTCVTLAILCAAPPPAPARPGGNAKAKRAVRRYTDS